MGVRLTGMWDGPAKAARGTGCTGGRAVVPPVSPMVRPVYWAHKPVRAFRHILPWQGPIVAVLYRFNI